MSLGFLVNVKKSLLSPTRKLEFLGFSIDLTKMLISLPRAKVHSITKLSRRLLASERVSIRDLARIVVMMVAAHPAILPAPLHYRCLEIRSPWH